MLTEKEKMQRAKLYLLKLCDGTDPITDKNISEDSVLKNERIIKCFQYVCQVLDENIKNEDRESRGRSSGKSARVDFYITEDEIGRVEVVPGECVISEFTALVNKAVGDEGRKKLQAKQINDWLVYKGYLADREISGGKTRRELTEKSNEIGISSKLGMGAFGQYTIILYSEKAQSYIIENLMEISKYKKEEREE